MIFRFRWQVLGGHTHVRVFAGIGPGPVGKCGELVFRNEEFSEFKASVLASDGKFEFIPEGIKASDQDD